MKTTKQITEEYNISRQTINNWWNQSIIPKPKKDWRGWYMWDQIAEKKLQNTLIQQANEQNNKRPLVNEIVNINNRRYLGSKQKILHFIDEVVSENTENVQTVADIFGGTGVVSNMFRNQGKDIIINDILHSNYLTYLTWFGREKVDYKRIKSIIKGFNETEVIEDNYVSINFGDKYFSIDNAKKIGYIREKIDTYYDLNEREKAFLLTSLLYAMDKVANTVGHYDAFRKKMDTINPINLKYPKLYKNTNHKIYKQDANKLVKEIKADLVYIDTPYNSRQYGDAYHLLENIMEWKKGEVGGVAAKMIDRSHIKSKYSTNQATASFQDMIQNINSKYILVSYNNTAKKGNGRSNAKISNEDIIEILSQRGKVKIFSIDFNVFTTGKTKFGDHKELLYLCEVKNGK